MTLLGKHRQFLLFVLAGGFAALVNLGARIAFNVVMAFEWAVIAAYLCGMTVAFVLSKLWVFEASGRPAHEEYVRFGLVNLVAIVQVWLVSVGLERYGLPWVGFTWHADTIAHAVGVAVPVFTSYLGHKHFSFAGHPPAQ